MLKSGKFSHDLKVRRILLSKELQGDFYSIHHKDKIKSRETAKGIHSKKQRIYYRITNIQNPVSPSH